MSNVKIMVNFPKGLIVHTEHHAGSTEYKALEKQGYVYVGVVKTQCESKLQFYWNADYFDPASKYIRPKRLRIKI